MQPTRPAITSGQLFQPDLFGLAPRRDCRVSHHSLAAVTRLCGSYPITHIFNGRDDGRYPLRCPSEPGLSSRQRFVAGDHSACAYSVFKELSNLESIALFASLSAMELLSLFIEIISILSKPLAICLNMS